MSDAHFDVITENQSLILKNQEILSKQLVEINEKLDLAYTELKEAYRGTVESLRYAVDAKDSYIKNHSDRVAYYSTLIGQKIGLSVFRLNHNCIFRKPF